MISPRSSTPLFLALLLTAPVAAQEYEPEFDREEARQGEVASEEGSSYGRLRFLDGSVTLRRDSHILDALEVNEPLIPGDTLRTGAASRLEAQTADGALLRLNEEGELVLLSLPDGATRDDETTLLQLLSGSLIVSAAPSDSSESRFQIDTDTASIYILTEGIFRVDVRPDGTTIVSSRRGAAEVSANDDSSMIRSGERVTIRPNGAPGDPQAFNTRLRDDFDDWSAERDDAMLRRARMDDETPPGLPAPIEPYADELSYYGRWFNSPSYGWVWRPVGLASDWQPYYYGRWAWSPSGMVWVSQEPWGWAPFHYGRWEFLIGTGWVWIPGHIFSGGWVAWSYSPGYFGWCPLGFYNYPVRFHIRVGGGYFPWIYVRSHHLYERRITRVCVRDGNIIRDIESRRVVVRRGPRFTPDRVRTSPGVATELHTRYRQHPEQQLNERASERRTPFRDQERRRLVQANTRRVEREARATRENPGQGRRPVTANERRAPSSRTSGGTVQRQRPSQQTSRPTRPRPSASPRTRPADETPREAERPQRWEPRQRTDRPDSRPSAGNREVPRERSRPERVVPRIVPRREPSGQSQSEPPRARPRNEGNSQRGGSSARAQAPRRSAEPRRQNPPQKQGERRSNRDKD